MQIKINCGYSHKHRVVTSPPRDPYRAPRRDDPIPHAGSELVAMMPTIQSADLGKLEVLEWNGVTPVFESADNHRLAITKVRVKFVKGFDDRFDIILRENPGQWDIFRLESFFPTAPPPGSGGQKSNDVFNF